MTNLLRKLSVRTKLYSSFLLLASFVLILGVTAIFIQLSLKKNQNETLASINLSDAFFEGKYFLRSDMHIFTELTEANDENSLNYWWGEHEFQIIFFNDQLQKIEKEFAIKNSINNDTLKTKLLSIIENISHDFDKNMVPTFNRFKTIKEKTIQLNYELSSKENQDSAHIATIKKELLILETKYKSLNTDVTRIGLDIIKNLDVGKDLVRVVILDIQDHGQKLMQRTHNIFLIFTILGVLFSVFITVYISQLITSPVNKILAHVNLLGKGEQPKQLKIKMQDEFGSIQKSLNILTESLTKTSEFSNEIGNGNFDTSFAPMSENDILGNSLIQMRDSLKAAKTEEENRRTEDERRAWAANGIAKFGDIMRQSGSSLKELSYSIMSNLIDYLDAVQGALFVLNDETDDDPYYELISAIAYGRNKFMKKEIRIGQGLVGRVAYEKKTIYLKEIPDNYVSISSGLGTSNPKTILLVPVKLENNVNGVIELISFKEFATHQIDFIEKVAENIASFIASIKINEKTAALLTDSQHKSEELAAQEEEMRQNMEELQATQEEAARRENEKNMLWESLSKAVGIIEADLTGVIQNVNEKASSILGFTLPELNNKNYQNLFFEKDANDIKSRWNDVKSGQHVSLQTDWYTGSKNIKISHDISLVHDVNGQGNKILILIKLLS